MAILETRADSSAPDFAANRERMEAIVNALCAAETLTGAGGATAYELPDDRLRELASSS